MEITFDPEADAMYIKLGNGHFSKNKKLDDLTILDLDKDGKIIGIELLSISKRIPPESLNEINVKNLPSQKQSLQTVKA